jgi:hypothetical protein
LEVWHLMLCYKLELILCYQLEHGEAVGQLVNALYRIKRQFQFWQAFKALRQATDLVSYGQVEAKV